MNLSSSILDAEWVNISSQPQIQSVRLDRIVSLALSSLTMYIHEGIRSIFVIFFSGNFPDISSSGGIISQTQILLPPDPTKKAELT